MANTYDAALVADILEDVAITTLGPVLADVMAFTHRAELNPISPRSTIQVPLVTAGASVLTNPANFESGDSTVDNVPVTVDLKSVPFHATNDEMQKGFRVRNLMEKNMQQLAKAVTDVVLTPITTANFAAETIDLAGVAFALSDLRTIWEAGKDFGVKNLVVDGSIYAKLIPDNANALNPLTQGAYGFDRIMMNNRWDGIGDAGNVLGFVADQTALAVATGEPYYSENVRADMTGMEMVTLNNGVQVQLVSWISRATRAEWRSLDIMIGAEAGDPAALRFVVDEGAA